MLLPQALFNNIIVPCMAFLFDGMDDELIVPKLIMSIPQTSLTLMSQFCTIFDAMLPTLDEPREDEIIHCCFVEVVKMHIQGTLIRYRKLRAFCRLYIVHLAPHCPSMIARHSMLLWRNAAIYCKWSMIKPNRQNHRNSQHHSQHCMIITLMCRVARGLPGIGLFPTIFMTRAKCSGTLWYRRRIHL